MLKIFNFKLYIFIANVQLFFKHAQSKTNQLLWLGPTNQIATFNSDYKIGCQLMSNLKFNDEILFRIKYNFDGRLKLDHCLIKIGTFALNYGYFWLKFHKCQDIFN